MAPIWFWLRAFFFFSPLKSKPFISNRSRYILQLTPPIKKKKKSTISLKVIRKYWINNLSKAYYFDWGSFKGINNYLLWWFSLNSHESFPPSTSWQENFEGRVQLFHFLSLLERISNSFNNYKRWGYLRCKNYFELEMTKHPNSQ